MLEGLKRGWREFWNPSLRCKREGHELELVTVKAYRWPANFTSHVADNVKYHAKRCKCCGMFLPPSTWKQKDYDGLSDLKMPSEDWDLLKQVGVFVTNPHVKNGPGLFIKDKEDGQEE